MRILVTEDDTTLAHALQFALQQDGYAVDWYADGIQADAALRQDVYCLLILDLSLPKMDGTEVLRRLRKHNTKLPVLILSGREKPEEKVAGLDLGADDYLSKPFSLSELQARVRALLRRQHGGATPTIQFGNLSFDTNTRSARIDGKEIALSLHEAGVLDVLLRRFGKAVSKEHLVEQLYSHDREASPNAIEVYVHRIRKKIEGAGVTVRTMHGRGYAIDYIVN